MLFATLALIAFFSIGFSVNTYASTADQTYTSEIEIMPLWTNIMNINVHLSFNSGRGSLGGQVIANAGTSHVLVTATLDRVNANGSTTHIATWSNMRAEGVHWIWERTHYVARGHDYRLTLTVTAVRNGVSETVSVSRTTRAD